MRKLISTSILALLCIGVYAQSQSWSELTLKEVPNYYEVKAEFDKEWAGKPYEKGKGYKQFKRWEEFALRHMNANGDVNKQIDFTSEQTSTKSPIEAHWKLVGPSVSPGMKNTGLEGVGRLDVLEFHPSDENIFWVGAPNGGLWKTIDGGKNWSHESEGWLNQSISAIAVNPSNPLEMYVGTGDRDGRTYATSGIMISSDGGSSFANKTLANGVTHIYRILVDPENGQRVLVLTNVGVYLSTNRGGTFSLTGTIQQGFDMEFKPGKSSVVYVSNSQGLYKSTNGGNSFQFSAQITGGLYSRLAVCAAEPNSVFISYATNTGQFFGLYKSSNSGVNFSVVANGQTASVHTEVPIYNRPLVELMGAQGSYDWALAVDPTNAEEITMAGVNLAKRYDNVSSWRQATLRLGEAVQSVPHADYHQLAYHPITGKLFAVTDGGVYREDNSGEGNSGTGEVIWEALNDGLSIAQIYEFDISEDANAIVVGAQDNGSYHYGNSIGWAAIEAGDGQMGLISPLNNNVAYASTQNNQVSYTTDGNSWNRLPWYFETNISELPPGGTEYAVDFENPGTIYMLYDNLWKSTNNGVSYQNITSSIGGGVSIVKMAPGHSNVLYVFNLNSTTLQGNIYKSINGGVSWNALPSPPLASDELFGTLVLFANTIEISQDDPNRIWVGTNNIYEYSGSSWSHIATVSNLGNSGSFINDISHEKGTNQIYVCLDNAIYVLPEGTSTWKKFSTGLPHAPYKDLVANSANKRLYAATYGRGIWESNLYGQDLSLTVNQSLKSAGVIVYPNPTNKEIFVDTKKTIQKLSLLDAQGRVVKESNSNRMETSTLSRGVYLLKIEFEGKTQQTLRIVKD